MVARVSEKQIVDHCSLVGTVVVENQMGIQFFGDRFLNDRQKLLELDGPVVRVESPNDFARGNVRGSKERGHSVAFVVMVCRAGVPGRSGSIGWARSSAWICDFSSTQSTTARSGGAM